MYRIKKINSVGAYTLFRGVSILAGIVKESGEHLDFWQGIHHALNASKRITQYYSPLPYQSYHVTTCNLVTERDHSNWNEYIDKHLAVYQGLFEQLKENEFHLEISIQQVLTEAAIQLVVTVPKQQQLAINSFAAKHQFSDLVPNFLHITLAYLYKEMDESALLAVQAELETLINPFINTKIILESTKLCYFNSMTQFTPWDGTINPFNNLVEAQYVSETYP